MATKYYSIGLEPEELLKTILLYDLSTWIFKEFLYACISIIIAMIYLIVDQRRWIIQTVAKIFIGIIARTTFILYNLIYTLLRFDPK